MIVGQRLNRAQDIFLVMLALGILLGETGFDGLAVVLALEVLLSQACFDGIKANRNCA